MNNKCKFCEIINGNIPAQVVYRDDTVIALLDIHPHSRGHTLVCPIQHYADMCDMPESTFRDVMTAAQRIAQHYRETLGATGTNILNASGKDAQQSVFHYHLHLLPRYPGDGIDAWPQMPDWKGDLDEILKLARIEHEKERTQSAP